MGDFMIIKTKKMSPREVKKKLHDFIDEISDGCGPEIEQMAEELKQYGNQFVDALSGYSGSTSAQFRNNGMGYRNGGGYSHSSFRNGNGGTSMRGEFRDDVPGNGAQMRDDTNWDEKEKKRQEENRQKMEQLEAEMQRLKMRMRDGSGY